jgi:hypothetical protein
MVSGVGQNSCARVSAGRFRAGTRAEATRDQRYKNEPNPGGSNTVTRISAIARHSVRSWQSMAMVPMAWPLYSSMTFVEPHGGVFAYGLGPLLFDVKCCHDGSCACTILFFAVPSQEEQALGCSLRRCLIRLCNRTQGRADCQASPIKAQQRSGSGRSSHSQVSFEGRLTAMRSRG